MLPEINWKYIKNVAFPVFKLRSSEVHYYRGVLYIENKIIDDRNLEGDTLGKRRLKILEEEKYYLKGAALDFVGLLQANHRHFITNKGQAFTYIKKKRCKVKSFKIKDVLHKDSFSVVKLEGIKLDFSVARPPPLGYLWASVIFINEFPWEIIEYSENKLVPYIRMI
jgi:hypothetical protein